MNQKTMELYKKHNFNVVGSCLIMIINLALTFVIFITLFNGLNSIARFKIEEQYLDLKTAYEQAYEVNSSVEEANAAVIVKYNEISNQYSWLWIKNVWQSDSPFNDSILTFDQYNNIVKVQSEDIETEKAVYEQIMNPLREQVGGPNGFLIVVVFAALLSFLAQRYAQITFKRNEFGKLALVNEKMETPQNGKIMLFILPVLMAFIAYSFNSVFGLYMIVSSLFGVITTPFINALIDKIDKRKSQKVDINNKPSYSR